MADSFQLEIVTPDKLVVKDTAEEMQIPGKNGYLGILPGHAPLITELAVGQISYRTGSETHYLCVAWGFAEVLPDKVTILAETAERGEDVDCTRAQKAKERAEKRLTGGDPEVDVDRAQKALAKANNRLEAAAREGKTATR
jgi:F-type H+-transporting ATPase subunit epsilon